MRSRDVDSLAGLHFRNLAESNPGSYGNSLVVHELGQLGVGTVLIPNKEAYAPDASSVIAHAARIVRNSEGIDTVSYDAPQEYQIGTSESGIDVVRARLLTPRELEEKIPVLNGSKLRKIGASKWRQYELAGGFMPRTMALADGEVFSDELVEQLQGDKVVVKADMSQASELVSIVDKSSAQTAVADMRREFAKIEKLKGKSRSNERILLQEFTPGEAMPELKAQTEEDREKIATAEQIELRVFCFVDAAHAVPDELRHYATVKYFKGDAREYAHIDQSSVPELVWRNASTISDRLLKAAGVSGGFFCIDMVKSNGQYMVREINTRDPMLVETDENFLEALKQRKLLANLMAKLATK